VAGETGGNFVAPSTHAQNKFLRVRFVFEPAICASKLSLAEPTPVSQQSSIVPQIAERRRMAEVAWANWNQIRKEILNMWQLLNII
jgi:hypothetical protein